VLQKFREKEIGTICKDYVDLKEKFKELGKGGFGKVYKYKQSDTGKYFAVKVEQKVFVNLLTLPCLYNRNYILPIIDILCTFA